MSLWSLFTPRARMRRYALLDAKGNCRALRESRQQPTAPGWVEVHELRTAWLGQPLPVAARAMPQARPAQARQALAA